MVVQTCQFCNFSNLEYQSQEKLNTYSSSIVPQPIPKELSEHSLSLDRRHVKVSSCHPKVRKVLRAAGFVTIPVTVPCLALLALTCIPFKLAAQQQEIEKFMCAECRLHALNFKDDSEPKNPLIDAPGKIIKLVPKLFKFIFKG